jgi:hypothetical protein
MDEKPLAYELLGGSAMACFVVRNPRYVSISIDFIRL